MAWHRAGDEGAGTASDEGLVKRIASGERQAMQVLYGRHSTRVFRFLQRMVRNESKAEDLMSDVFLDVWQQAGRFEGRSSVATWILSIARFKALSSFRQRQHEELDPEAEDSIEDEADNPEVALQKTGKANALQRCLLGLSAAHREVIDLVYYHERSVEEVSVILGIPENTVKTRMFHARKRLSELLKQAGIDRGWP
jgi:RNA polymerase sigma-70 factor (ECF subfamily)